MLTVKQDQTVNLVPVHTSRGVPGVPTLAVLQRSKGLGFRV